MTVVRAIKHMLAKGRNEFGGTLAAVEGIVLGDAAFERALDDQARIVAPERIEQFKLAHAVWLDVTSCNGKTRLWRASSLGRALVETGFTPTS